MSKQMTPCEKLGYKVGDKFKVVDGTGVHYAVGSFITLIHDDGSSCPRFNGVHAIFESGDSFFPLDFVEKVAKLKPAKQALADAIHQSGGWPIEVHWLFSTSSRVGAISFWVCRPKFNSTDWFEGVARRVTIVLNRCLPNWHQCILSRDEYFTAYPEQVKVEAENETEHEVEVEMKSESEVAISVIDWHKSGDLPPVGEVCEVMHLDRWVCCEVIAHFEQSWGMVAAYTVGINGGNAKLLEQCDAEDFRPLRTEREKAIDEMVCEFIDHHGDPKGGERYLGIAAKLYDAGYRKEVKQ